MVDATPERGKSRGQLWLVILIAGIVALGATLGLTARQIANADARGCTPPKTGPAQGALIAVAYEDFRLGQGLCIGVNLPAYFASERAAPRTGTAPRTATLQVFFDRHATPATVTLDIDAAGNAAGPWAGWQWTLVPLRPATTADSTEGRKWRALLTEDGIAPLRAVSIGVATKPADADAALPRARAATKPVLEVFAPWLTALGAFGIIAIATGIVMACWDTGLLRDRTPSGATDRPPFSLGRVQMAVWLVLSVGGYLAIWLITGARSGLITPGLLTLLGISGMSGLAARMIDVANPTPTTAQSAGFWRDIVSEGYGATRTVAVHRLQMLAWTLILGMIFLWTVLTSFAFPDFDTNLLLLMGISSGTYLGFKFPEKGAA